MVRPTVRTTALEPRLLAELKDVFGSASVAYRNLEITASVSYPVFVRAWSGERERPDVVRAIGRGFVQFKRRMGKLNLQPKPPTLTQDALTGDDDFVVDLREDDEQEEA